jgi:hypothetical protein
MIVKFTHDRVIDYVLPGIPPTRRQVEIAAVVVAQFRDGKLASEHVYWDQASVLGVCLPDSMTRILPYSIGLPPRAGVWAAASYELRPGSSVHVSVGPCDAIEPIKSLTAARRPASPSASCRIRFSLQPETRHGGRISESASANIWLYSPDVPPPLKH